ncbi:MAG: copper amine oxidase N-terminal domain-containing protein [Clostridiaceae bacterium]|nr:copper amine oxidase N-terminal domain-containing protein [Clostridiaceae bacterium]
MKKSLFAILLVLIICITGFSANNIEVLVNDEAVEFDVQPQIIQDRVMVPMRFIFEKLNSSVMYDGETRTISTYLSDKNGQAQFLIIQINNPKAFVNNNSFVLDAAPIEVEDRTLVSLDLFEKTLGATVTWDEQNMKVSIQY